MAGSINKVILLGRLGGDPEIRVSQEGNKIARRDKPYPSTVPT